MSIVNSIETVREWLDSTVCPMVQLKLPDDSATDASYPYKLVNPTAFSLFRPVEGQIAPKGAGPHPLGLRADRGGHRQPDHELEEHQDPALLLCVGSRLPRARHLQTENDGSGAYVQWQNEEAAAFFEKNGEGWRDAWNFVDTALRMIENAEYIGPLRVMKEDGITFGPVSEQDAVPDFYPYWFAWVEFSAEEPLTRTPKDYQHLL